MQRLKVMVADDEALALSRLRFALSEQPQIELAGTAMSGAEAVALARLARPDVVLLDVQMAAFGGFQVMRALADEDPPLVIFVTAFENFAVQAFDVRAVDYLLKPVDFERLGLALDRARDVLARRPAEQPEPEAAQAETVSEFWAERRGTLARVRTARIEWLESERDYVRLHTEDGSYLMRGPLHGVCERLDVREFVRVRRSAVVRADAVTGMRQLAYDDCRLILRSGREVRVGVTYLNAIQQVLRAGG
ncbi:MAG: DNA-binding response regulator [Phenylobacterium zucineum]|nr:MAG: DNA-binding response regulator [Phenylobacterium zucineum]